MVLLPATESEGRPKVDDFVFRSSNFAALPMPEQLFGLPSAQNAVSIEDVLVTTFPPPSVSNQGLVNSAKKVRPLLAKEGKIGLGTTNSYTDFETARIRTTLHPYAYYFKKQNRRLRYRQEYFARLLNNYYHIRGTTTVPDSVKKVIRSKAMARRRIPHAQMSN